MLPDTPSLALRLTACAIALALGGCGMKGPLQHPSAPPPPVDATLAAPPTVAPAAQTSPVPAAQP